jgi:hypothetical protein
MVKQKHVRQGAAHLPARPLARARRTSARNTNLRCAFRAGVGAGVRGGWATDTQRPGSGAERAGVELGCVGALARRLESSRLRKRARTLMRWPKGCRLACRSWVIKSSPSLIGGGLLSGNTPFLARPMLDNRGNAMNSMRCVALTQHGVVSILAGVVFRK